MGFNFEIIVVTLLLFCQHLCWAGEVEDALLHWLSAHGGTYKGVGIAEFDGMGRGIEAVKNIREGDDILKIPNKLIISVKTAFSSADRTHRKIAKMFKNQEQAVIGILAYEKLRGNESLWAPYFDILPNYVSNFAFSGFLPGELQDEKLEKDAVNTVSRLRTEFKIFEKTVKPFWPPSVPAPTIDIYQWASAVIDSRALRFEGDIKLIPITDIFNYAPHPVRRKKNSGNFFLQHHKLSDKGLVVTADRDCLKGNQLFEDYGDNEDNIYAQYHGFVAAENPFRCVEYKADFASDLQGKPDALVKLFQALKIDSNMRKCVDSSGDLGLGLVVYECALVFNETEIDTCASAVAEKRGDWNGIFELCGFSEVHGGLAQYLTRDSRASVGNVEDTMDNTTLSARFLSSVKERIQRYVTAFPTSLNFDENLLLKINEELRFSPDDQESPFAQDKNLDKLKLSVRYRIAIKQHWAHLCCLYNAYCCPLSTDLLGDTGATVKSSAESDEGGDGLLYRTVDWEGLTMEENMDLFLEWFDAAGPSIRKIKPALIPGFRIGTIAISNIDAGEVYLTVPTKLIMDSEKAIAEGSGVSSLLQQLSGKYGNRDNFHELLLFLIYEYFSGGVDSFYWPYLSMLPRPEDMDIPLMWSSDEEVGKKLEPSLVGKSVDIYRASVRNSFNKISKIGIIRNFFGLDAPSDDGVIGGASVFTFENYRWATAILDSRSIWWSGERHLVPLLDLVNCAEGPLSHQVHSTALSENGDLAVTKAGWGFDFGTQVFEQYGQPNHIYFLYHGFVLNNNSFDCVHVDLFMSAEEMGVIDWTKHRPLLQKLGLRDPAAAFHHCMKVSVPESVWVYLTLKLNLVDEMIARGTLGSATMRTGHVLLDYLDSRLYAYRNYFSGNNREEPGDLIHRESNTNAIRFLNSEYDTLQNVRKEVQSTITYLAANAAPDEL